MQHAICVCCSSSVKCRKAHKFCTGLSDLGSHSVGHQTTELLGSRMVRSVQRHNLQLLSPIHHLTNAASGLSARFLPEWAGDNRQQLNAGMGSPLPACQTTYHVPLTAVVPHSGWVGATWVAVRIGIHTQCPCKSIPAVTMLAMVLLGCYKWVLLSSYSHALHKQGRNCHVVFYAGTGQVLVPTTDPASLCTHRPQP
jgi:hypothetical protein